MKSKVKERNPKGDQKKLHHELYMYIGAQYMYQTPYRYDRWDAANTLHFDITYYV